jgi:asparagine synthase (glutamine-hydrolysing)
MKLQLGLFHLDGQLSGPDDMATILGEFLDRPAETGGAIADGPLLMAYRGDKLTVEEQFEIQPLQSGPFLLTWDGRLDNREELGRRLGLKHLNKLSDPAIVLHAHQVLGDAVFDDLLGEFALALWCHTTRSLQFARSTCGARTLYYVLNKNNLIWSSDFLHLVRTSGVDLTINKDFVVRYLLSRSNSNLTPFQKVHAIPQNSLVRFEDGYVKAVRQLWDPDRIARLRYRSDKEYEDHCREKLREAVQVRLRAAHPVFSELSGGLDSSVLVLTADQILREQHQEPQKLRTLSCVYEQSQTCDETGYIRAIERTRGVPTFEIREKDQEITLSLENPQFTGIPSPLHFFSMRYPRFAEIMRAHGARVLFTGSGGDHLFWSALDGAPVVADALRQLKFMTMHRECQFWSQAASVSYYDLIVKSMALALNGPFISASNYMRPVVPTWLARKHKDSIRSTILDVDRQDFSGPPSRRARLMLLNRLFNDLGAGHFNCYSQIYVSHPYTHRPLVEFCLGAPISQFLRNGQTRSIMRRSFSKLLPAKTVRRISKGNLDEAIVRALRREWSTISDVHRWQVCELGFAEPSQLEESLSRARLGFCELSSSLLTVFSMERWLRSLRRKSDCPVSVGAVASSSG